MHQPLRLGALEPPEGMADVEGRERLERERAAMLLEHPCRAAHLMHQCDQQYAGDFATLLRNLEHDARELRLRSSVGAQMALRPPETYRAPESRLQEQHALGHDGYETARRKQRETLDRVYAHGLHKPLTGESELVDTNGYVYNRTKGTIPDWGNCANWCAARMRHDPRNPF